MSEEIIELKEDVSASPLYSADLAPVPKDQRTWSVWTLAALWVGMAVCIPTYMLAAQFIVDHNMKLRNHRFLCLVYWLIDSKVLGNKQTVVELKM